MDVGGSREACPRGKIMQIIQNDTNLTNEIREVVAEYDLQLLFDTATREIKFQK